MGGFFIASAAITLLGLNMGVRRASIEVNADTLRVRQLDLLCSRRYEWLRGDIAAVRVAGTGFSVGGTKKRGGVGCSGVHGHAIAALYVDLTSGRTVRLLTGRSAKELHAIAEQLREALERGGRRGR